MGSNKDGWLMRDDGFWARHAYKGEVARNVRELSCLEAPNLNLVCEFGKGCREKALFCLWKLPYVVAYPDPEKRPRVVCLAHVPAELRVEAAMLLAIRRGE